MNALAVAALPDDELAARIAELEEALLPLLAERECRARSAGQKRGWADAEFRARRLAALKVARGRPETEARRLATLARTNEAKYAAASGPQRIRTQADAAVLSNVARDPVEAELFGLGGAR